MDKEDPRRKKKDEIKARLNKKMNDIMHKPVDENPHVFLLTTRWGGIGINLQA